MTATLRKNLKRLQVLTDTGWSNFEGILDKGCQLTAEVMLTKNKIIATLDHDVFTESLNKLQVRQLKPGSKVQTSSGTQRVVSVRLLKKLPVFDLLNVENNQRFYANNILCSNCEFIIYDETLVSSIILTDLRASEPLMQMAQVRWFKQPQKGRIYLVALDPSAGTGGDPAAIQVFDAQSAEQIAEWRHNKTNVNDQVKVVIDIVKYIDSVIEDGQNNIYYTVENNGVGEAALVAIFNYGEENIPGYFLRESGGGRSANSSRKFRGGFNTTHKPKITACVKLKEMIEKRRMKIHSQGLLSELKTFIARGNTFAAKDGYTDDLVMATVLIIRMMGELQHHYPDMDKMMRDNESDYIMPMPFISSAW